MCKLRHKMQNAKKGVGPTFVWWNEAWCSEVDKGDLVDVDEVDNVDFDDCEEFFDGWVDDHYEITFLHLWSFLLAIYLHF